jgi:hypothetical protein
MPREVHSFFEASTYTILGDGRSTAFWTGRWIQSKVVKHIAPSLLRYISRRDIRQTTVADGLQGRAWVRQITGGISVPATHQPASLGLGRHGNTKRQRGPLGMEMDTTGDILLQFCL